MHAYLAALTLATLAHRASSQSTTTLTIPFYGYDSQPVVASILAVQDSVTTMALACAPDTDSNDCGLAPSQTLIYGPSTYNMDAVVQDQFTATQDCSRDVAATTAVCTESLGGPGADAPGVATVTYGGQAESRVDDILVTVTAGAERLAQSATTATGDASSESLTTSGTTSETTSGASTGLASTSSSSSSTGAASLVTPAVMLFAAVGGLVGVVA